MSIDELMAHPYGRKTPVSWEQRDDRSVPEIAREKISKYFSECSKYNIPSVFVTYQINPKELGFFDRLFGRNPVFEEWIFQGDKGEIKICPWNGRKTGKKPIYLEDYLMHIQCVRLTFMFGSHDNGNCIIDSNSSSSRIGVVSK